MDCTATSQAKGYGADAVRGEYKLVLEKKAVMLEKTGKHAVLDRADDQALTDYKVALAKAENGWQMTLRRPRMWRPRRRPRKTPKKPNQRWKCHRRSDYR